MKKQFYKRMWENVLDRHFQFGNVEITDYRPGTFPCEWYGTFTFYSHLIEHVERHYFFKIRYGKISFTLIK